ncbi:hypothetical protein [Photobacterium leiognathi]|uniref:hypothetical protein n=1 Tax=Photobacterium leiognathi TaxID=553611 RepID=UPI0029829702|nr:hypothetical protein [Photobacterium leiognathi]
MDKKIKINDYVTFIEAANYLSKAFGESVSLAEVYRLILSKKLTASIRLLNPTCAVGGRYISNEGGHSCNDEQGIILVDQMKRVVFDQTPCLIDGIWDLPLIGCASFFIEDLYQKELNEVAPIHTGVQGLFICQGNSFFKLQNVVAFPSDDKKKTSLLAKLFPILNNESVSLFDLIFKSDSDVQDLIKKTKTDKGIAAFKAFKKQPSSKFVFDDVLSLEQQGHQLIIRSDELLRFADLSKKDVVVEASMNDSKLGKPSEEYDLLVLIGIFCIKAGVEPSARGVTPAVQKMVELVGVSMSDDCIRQVLSQAAQALDKKYCERTLTSKRRNTLLILIGALCSSAGITSFNEDIVREIQSMAEQVGVCKSHDFIKQVFLQSKSAIEKRQK